MSRSASAATRSGVQGRARRGSLRGLGLAAGAVAIVLVAVACSAGSSPSVAPSGTAGGAASPTAPASAAPSIDRSAPGSSTPSVSSPSSAAPTSPVVGVVLGVTSSGLTKVESFTIRTDAGEQLTFAVGDLAQGSFPAGHLGEHAATGEPVQVTFDVVGGTLVATNLADAP